MSVIVPVDRAGWLTAVLELEAAGEPATVAALAEKLHQPRAHTKRMMAKLRDAGVLAGARGGARVSARGRWYMGRPVLIYAAAAFDQAAGAALDIAAGVGPPAAPLVPAAATLAAAAAGDPWAMEVLITFATRADVVVVVDRDPLTEMRPDVVAAQRADVTTLVAPEAAAIVILETLCSGGRRP